MSVYNIKVTEKAEWEYHSAYLYYEQERVGLGSEFELEIEKSFKLIVQNPLLFPRKYKQHREALIRKFPYFIVYEIFKNSVIVHSVFHTSRNPKIKYLK